MLSNISKLVSPNKLAELFILGSIDLSKLNKFVKRHTHPVASPMKDVSDVQMFQKHLSTLDAIKDMAWSSFYN